MHKKQSRLTLVTGGVVVALAGLLTVLLTVVGPAQGESPGSAGHEEPAHVEHREGSDIARLTLTSKAASRIDVQTAAVETGRQGLQVVPYGALIYDPQGGTWVYTYPGGPRVRTGRRHGELHRRRASAPAQGTRCGHRGRRRRRRRALGGRVRGRALT